MKKIFLFFFLTLIISSIVISVTITKINHKPSFEERREQVLLELHEAIEDAEEEGRYRCCIEPACTMCYQGDWIWKDGSCYCDDMIEQGEDDKVCPQCKNGLEQGLCKSLDESGQIDPEHCNTENGAIFKEMY